MMMEWNGMEWNGMEWNGMEWNGMEWNGMEWNLTEVPRHRQAISDCSNSKQTQQQAVLGVGGRTWIHEHCTPVQKLVQKFRQHCAHVTTSYRLDEDDVDNTYPCSMTGTMITRTVNSL